MVFLFVIELATERRVTDDYYTDERVSSVIILLTEFIPVTDRSSPSVKLFSGVVATLENKPKRELIRLSPIDVGLNGKMLLFGDPID